MYATSDRLYARYYASRFGHGSLYEVALSSDAHQSDEDPSEFPTWRASSATVLRVVERGITLTWSERERLFIRWGGTRGEFREMVDKIVERGA